MASIVQHRECSKETCGWNSRDHGKDQPIQVLDGKPHCGRCSAPTRHLRLVSKKLSRAIWRINDERLKGPPMDVEGDIKVRFDIREKTLNVSEGPKDVNELAIAEIRFQIWDDRLKDVTRLRGCNEVPWCLMKHDNPAMVIRGKHWTPASRWVGDGMSNWVEQKPILYFSKELSNKIFDEPQFACYYYGYQARRSYVEATDTRLKRLSYTEAKRDRLYDRLRAEHIRALASMLARLKKESFLG